MFGDKNKKTRTYTYAMNAFYFLSLPKGYVISGVSLSVRLSACLFFG